MLVTGSAVPRPISGGAAGYYRVPGSHRTLDVLAEIDVSGFEPEDVVSMMEKHAAIAAVQSVISTDTVPAQGVTTTGAAPVKLRLPAPFASTEVSVTGFSVAIKDKDTGTGSRASLEYAEAEATAVLSAIRAHRLQMDEL